MLEVELVLVLVLVAEVEDVERELEEDELVVVLVPPVPEDELVVVTLPPVLPLVNAVPPQAVTRGTSASPAIANEVLMEEECDPIRRLGATP